MGRILTTAELSTAYGMIGKFDEAEKLLRSCLKVRDREGRLPEQFEGTYFSKIEHENWKNITSESTPVPWLAWSHTEVLRAYIALKKFSHE